MTPNEYITAAIVFWQKSSHFHPLTCGNDSSHALLEPALNEETSEIFLICPDCDYTQTYIPNSVLEIAADLMRDRHEN